MDEGEFYLPVDFLSDDLFAGEETANETESDDDDSVAALARQMQSHSLKNKTKEENPKASVMATSPQSTLCGIGSWSFSSSESPDGQSLVSSPPSTPLQKPRDDALDLLYAAAGQVERLRLNNQRNQEPSYQIPVADTKNLIQQQLQAARFKQLKRQQLLKQQQQQQQQSRAKTVKPHGLSNSAWPPLQKQQQQLPGSGMTAVFLNGGKRQSNGTGVFLPRRIGTPNEPKKKTGCSTVLLPARVVQALNLNLEDMGVFPRLPNNDAVIALENLKKNTTSPEIRLPQGWTY